MRGGASLVLALLVPAGVLSGPAAAQLLRYDEFGLYPGPQLPSETYRYRERRPLPESISGVVRPGPADRLGRVDRIREVFEAVRACWRPPGDGGYTGEEITLRLAFRRTGEVLGEPRITYYRPGSEPERRAAFTRAVREAFERCTPLPFTPAFGAAVAGRPFTIRFSDTRPL
ncbi:MAG TPA: hypothetical protein VHL98_23410 [Microvirga sp.]|jgi:hypothetical protein|nr:hypothetical protein [Microvirga sp.]